MRKRRFLSAWIQAFTVLLASFAAGQQPPVQGDSPGWRGTWMASAGAHSFRGRWWAELLPKSHDAASGSWTLLSDSNQVVLEGTWSARKLPSGWQGTWAARLNSGQAYSGTWTADLNEGRTFEDMLGLTLAKQVTGLWRSRRMGGSWRLLGPG